MDFYRICYNEVLGLIKGHIVLFLGRYGHCSSQLRPKAVMVEQDSTLRNGGKFEIRRTRTTARRNSWMKPFKATSPLMLFHAVLIRPQASPARYVTQTALSVYVCPSVCLSVCAQDVLKSYCRINFVE